MWRRWGKAPVSRHGPSSSSSSSPFSCSFSFKDIQNLCAQDSSNSPAPGKPPAVFHRVRSIAAPRLPLPATPPPIRPEPEPKSEPSSARSPSSSTLGSDPCVGLPPGTESRIVVYFTSLRVVRPTFEDCRTVRSILRGFRVPMDERDLSMDSGFLEELQRILGGGDGSSPAAALPRVFIGGRYVGGREEVQQLHESGQLKKFVDGMPAAEPGVCEVCGGYRFVLCDDCNGSHKCYAEKGGGVGGFRCCAACNENGLVRCPSCFPAAL